ncbi:hypothetical protein IAU59_004279 [Kwoniella sp. CBS 9459]
MQRYHPYPPGGASGSSFSSDPHLHANTATHLNDDRELYNPVRNGINHNDGSKTHSLYPPGMQDPGGSGEMYADMHRVKSEGYERGYPPHPHPHHHTHPHHQSYPHENPYQQSEPSYPYTNGISSYPPPGGGMSMDDTAIGSSLGKRRNISGPQSRDVTPSAFASTSSYVGDEDEKGYLQEQVQAQAQEHGHGPGSAQRVGTGAQAGGSGGGANEAKVKKTRQSPCRARKVKCDRPPPGSSNPAVPHKDICSHCEHLGLACTFDYKPKKRGPPNMYMRRLQGESGPGPSRARSGSVTPVSGSPVRAASHPLPTIIDPALSGEQNRPVPNPTYLEGSRNRWANRLAAVSSRLGVNSNQLYQDLSLPSSSFHNSGTLSADSSPVSRDQFLPPLSQQSAQPLQQHLPPGATTFVYPPSHPHPHNAPSHTYTPPPRSHNFVQTHNPYPSPQVSPSVPRPIYTYVDHPFNPANPLDAVLPRSTLHQILDLFFDYIYCLIPCVHRPSFTHDVNTKREERVGQEEWTALVLIIVASTLVQLPRSFISMSRKEVRELVIACYDKVKDYLIKDYEQITVTRTIIVYHCLFVTRMMGKMVVGKGDLGMNYSYMLALRAHEEKTYALLNPLERILQRRAFWVMYGADRTIAAIEGTPVFFHEDDCSDVAYPEEVDDEYISEQGILPQPEGHTSILSGFHYISRLHRITGQYLDKQRRDKRKPPSGLSLQMRLNEVNELYERTMSLMDHCPAPLKLEYRSGSKSVQSLSPGWDARAKEDIVAIFSDPNFDTEIVKDFYLVQQANIYVTQQMVRLMILQYRDELHELQQDSPETSGAGGSGGGVGMNGAGRENNQAHGSGEGTFSNEKDEVVVDLLAILQKIPLKVLAVNSFPIVSKVQVIASTLLDAVDNSGDNAAPPMLVPTVTETRAQKAQRNLWQFLNILSEIENLYSLTDD